MHSKECEEVCELLDKLYLDSVCLMEEKIQTMINLEKSMVEGETNLAKCRYIMGSNSVSSMNIPLNPEEEISPILSIKTSPNEIYPEVIECKVVSDNKNNMTNPIKWFGFFTQQNLINSQKSYSKSLDWAVQAVNVQNQLNYLCNKFEVLKYVKTSLVKTEE